MDLAELLQECGAVQFGDFRLTSGRRSKFYVNLKLAATRPQILERIASEMVQLLPDKAEVIAGMELGAVPLAVALSLKTGLPYVMIRKGERVHGTGSRIEGELLGNVIVVEDVATSGGSLVDAAEVIRRAGGTVERAIVVVDREEGADEALRAVDIELLPLVRIGSLLQDD
ncbi:MAG: orotate phosphoribosyltransferase [Candidatus Poseidoniia archaeon]|jgi:orotate phosphoribosyltransferase|nr:orotate phosphoribosyltransferase [Candidatus Poseidoniia archaeon]HJP43914.1 orotate phosphoribosyltransferase [Candidatus Poseidoniia archaeon]